jgi:hypothetical protein
MLEDEAVNMLEILIDIKEVDELNNKYFSPFWADPNVKTILMK